MVPAEHGITIAWVRAWQHRIHGWHVGTVARMDGWSHVFGSVAVSGAKAEVGLLLS